MENPVQVICLKNQWTLVGHGVSVALLHKKNNAPVQYSWTYRKLNDSAPTLISDGIIAFEGKQTEQLFFQQPVDVYVYALEKNGQIRFDDGVNFTSSGIPDWTQVKLPNGLVGAARITHNLGRHAELVGDPTYDLTGNILILNFAHQDNYFDVSATNETEAFTIKYR